MTYAPTAIDFSRLPAPEAIEIISLEQLDAAYRERFLAEWAIQQALDASLLISQNRILQRIRLSWLGARGDIFETLIETGSMTGLKRCWLLCPRVPTWTVLLLLAMWPA